jgi:two-component system sensor histidine kinase GlrK
VGPLTPEQAEVAQLLHTNSLQLQRLIEDLLSFSATRSTATPITARPVRLDRVVETVLARHKLAVRSKHLQVNTEIGGLWIHGDSDKLCTIVDNLLSNAVKYSPPGGRLWIRARPDGPLALLDVQDEGPGIPREERERVFDAFFQGRSPQTGHVRGSGLGLSIAREYAKAHQGDIHVIVQEHGALLRVTLPMAHSGTP